MITTLLYFAPLLSLEVKTKVPAGSECNAPCGFFYVLIDRLKMPVNRSRIAYNASKTKNSIISLPKRFECVIAKVFNFKNFVYIN